MKIEQFSIDKIKPYEKNNRKHDAVQIDRIAASIKEFGFNQPIVIEQNGTILVGHGRYEAAKKLALKTVPVLVKTDLTETQKRAYRILDNKLQNDSTWDFGNIEMELDFLKENDFDINFGGLSDLLPKNFDILADNENDGSGLDSPAPIICPECGHEFIKE